MTGCAAAGLVVNVALPIVVLASCTGNSTQEGQTPPDEPVERSIQEVQEAFTREWMDLPGVVGTGIGLCDAQPCIKVFVAGPLRPLQELIPSEVEGHRVVLESTGQFQARDSGSEADRGRDR